MKVTLHARDKNKILKYMKNSHFIKEKDSFC